MPTSIFIPEMIATYPSAKVLMTVRDVDAWYDSLRATILGPAAQETWLQWLLERADPTLHQIFTCLRLHNRLAFGGKDYMNLTREQAGRIWEEQLETARRLTPEGMYLEFDVRQGWEPLCEFLGKPVPRDEKGEVKPFPRLNDSAMFAAVLKPYIMGLIWRKLVLPGLAVLGTVGALGAAVYWRGPVSTWAASK